MLVACNWLPELAGALIADGGFAESGTLPVVDAPYLLLMDPLLQAFPLFLRCWLSCSCWQMAALLLPVSCLHRGLLMLGSLLLLGLSIADSLPPTPATDYWQCCLLAPYSG